MIDCDPLRVEYDGYNSKFGTPCPYHYPELVDAWQIGQIARLAETGYVFYARGIAYLIICDGMVFRL